MNQSWAKYFMYLVLEVLVPKYQRFKKYLKLQVFEIQVLEIFFSTQVLFHVLQNNNYETVLLMFITLLLNHNLIFFY